MMKATNNLYIHTVGAMHVYDVMEGMGPVYLGQLDCTGFEKTLLDCPQRTYLAPLYCDHSSDTGVFCPGKTMSCLVLKQFKQSLLALRFQRVRCQ